MGTAPAFNLHLRQSGDIWIVRPEGVLDEANAGRIVAEVATRLAGGARKFVLDGSSVLTVDSAGLGKLIRCYSDVRTVAVTLVLAQISSELRRTLNLTRLVRFFSLYPSIDEALAGLK